MYNIRQRTEIAFCHQLKSANCTSKFLENSILEYSGSHSALYRQSEEHFNKLEEQKVILVWPKLKSCWLLPFCFNNNGSNSRKDDYKGKNESFPVGIMEYITFQHYSHSSIYFSYLYTYQNKWPISCSFRWSTRFALVFNPLLHCLPIKQTHKEYNKKKEKECGSGRIALICVTYHLTQFSCVPRAILWPRWRPYFDFLRFVPCLFYGKSAHFGLEWHKIWIDAQRDDAEKWHRRNK